MNRQRRIFFLEHLDELRYRLIRLLIFFTAAVFVSYFFSAGLVKYFSRLAGTLIFVYPAEAFLLYVNVAVWCGLFISMPYIFFEVWSFIASGLSIDEKRYFILCAVFSIILFMIGLLLGYFVALPVAYNFLMQFGSTRLVPMISVKSYFDFAVPLVFGFGLVFQLPLVMVFLSRAGLVSPDFFSRYRREAIVLIFVVAAILTPPDIASQVMMAVPLYILYEISILCSIWGRRK